MLNINGTIQGVFIKGFIIFSFTLILISLRNQDKAEKSDIYLVLREYWTNFTIISLLKDSLSISKCLKQRKN